MRSTKSLPRRLRHQMVTVFKDLLSRSRCHVQFQR
jgi:hypothetical protein